MIYYDPQSAKVLLLEMTGSINGKCYKKMGHLLLPIQYCILQSRLSLNILRSRNLRTSIVTYSTHQHAVLACNLSRNTVFIYTNRLHFSAKKQPLVDFYTLGNVSGPSDLTQLLLLFILCGFTLFQVKIRSH